MARDWQCFAATRCPQARERLFRAYAPLCRMVARKFCGSATALCDAGDMLAFAYMGLDRALERYESQRKRSFEGFAVVVMSNLIRDELRRVKGERSVLSLDAPLEVWGETVMFGDALESPCPSPESQIQDAEGVQRLYALLQKLPAEYRDTVTLICLQGLSYAEAGQRMEVPTGTVRSRVFRGRKLLRELWEAK